MTTISELCQQLAATRNGAHYHLIDRYTLMFVATLVDLIIFKSTKSFHCLINILIRLVLTLSVSTASTERAFSAMQLVTTRLQNQMEDGFLRDHLVTYTEKEIVIGISIDAIIEV
jgi:hypothetical protein